MAQYQAEYTGSFGANVGYNTHPETSLSGPNVQIPSYALVRSLKMRVYSGVGAYNSELDAGFTVSDSDGASVSIDDVVYTGTDSRIWAEFGGSPNRQLNWNGLASVHLYGSNKLFTRQGSTVYLYVEYDLPTPPGPPTNVRCEPSSVASGKSTLKWSASEPGESNPVSKYEIWSFDFMDGYPVAKIGETTGLSFSVDSATDNGSEVAFVVKAIGSVPDKDSIFSGAARLKTEWSAPGTPETPTLSANNVPPEKAVILSWRASTAGINNPVIRYDVYRSVDGGGFSFLTSVSATAATVYSPNRNGLPYVYKVKAIGKVSGSDSAFSGPSDALYSSFSAPSAPSNLNVNGTNDVFVDAGSDLRFSWMPGKNGVNNPIQGYTLYKDGTRFQTVQATEITLKADYRFGSETHYTVKSRGTYSDSVESNSVTVTINIPPVPPRSLESISEFMFFDKDDKLLFLRNDAVSLTVTEEEFRCNGLFPYDPEKEIRHGMRIGWLERDNLLLYEIRQPSTDAVMMTQAFEAEHVSIAELLDEAIEDARPTNKTAAQAVEIALKGTGWILGEDTFKGEIKSTEFYMESVWSALLQIRDKWGATISPRIAYTFGGMIRYIDVLDRRGENRGVRLTLKLNAQQAGITYDDRDLYTALYGQGSSPGEGQRLITFEDAFWSVDNGDPTNKPIGQKWVEDEDATKFFGRKGRKRTGFVKFETLDPKELLIKTWDALQNAKTPRVTVNMTAFNLAAIGYSWQGLEWGDDVVVVMDEIGVEIAARVTQFERDVLRPENSKPVIGDYRPDIVFELSKSKGV